MEYHLEGKEPKFSKDPRLWAAKTSLLARIELTKEDRHFPYPSLEEIQKLSTHWTAAREIRFVLSNPELFYPKQLWTVSTSAILKKVEEIFSRPSIKRDAIDKTYQRMAEEEKYYFQSMGISAENIISDPRPRIAIAWELYQKHLIQKKHADAEKALQAKAEARQRISQAVDAWKRWGGNYFELFAGAKQI